MRRCISIRGCVRPSVRWSVRPSVRPSPVIFKRVLGASCAVYPALFISIIMSVPCSCTSYSDFVTSTVIMPYLAMSLNLFHTYYLWRYRLSIYFSFPLHLSFFCHSCLLDFPMFGLDIFVSVTSSPPPPLPPPPSLFPQPRQSAANRIHKATTRFSFLWALVYASYVKNNYSRQKILSYHRLLISIFDGREIMPLRIQGFNSI